MAVLQQKDRDAVQKKFDMQLKRDVDIELYTQANIPLYIPGRECSTCAPTQELIEEISSLSPKLHLEVVDFYKNRDDASGKGVERIPALIIGSSNVRFFGMPSGYEFALLIDSIVGASERRSSLKLESRRHLKGLSEDVHIQVFVTPTCRYCPSVAQIAHAMAMESPNVTADVIEVQEFPDLARGYSVMSVPKTVINDRVTFTGAMSEDELMERVLEAVGAKEPDEDGVAEVSDKTTLVR